jgi:hypothetical protein
VHIQFVVFNAQCRNIGSTVHTDVREEGRSSSNDNDLVRRMVDAETPEETSSFDDEDDLGVRYLYPSEDEIEHVRQY